MPVGCYKIYSYKSEMLSMLKKTLDPLAISALIQPLCTVQETSTQTQLIHEI